MCTNDNSKRVDIEKILSKEQHKEIIKIKFAYFQAYIEDVEEKEKNAAIAQRDNAGGD